MGTIRGLRINPVAGFRGIFQRLQDMSGTVIAGGVRSVAKKQRCGACKQFLYRIFGTAHGDLTTRRADSETRGQPALALEEFMLAKALVIAMAADIARSDYAKPTLIRSRSREWLIACRWGPEGEYLSIATAGPVTEPLALVAPQVIAPIHSLVGVLVSESESQSTSTFLLVRQLPGAIELAGTFFPSDGYVLLQDQGDIHLVCKARYSHSCGWVDGKPIRKDIADPAPYSAEANSWHIEATRRDWIREVLPRRKPADRLAIRATG